MTIELEQDIPLLQNARFRRLLESRIIGQTAQNAMVYAVLILLVKTSGSSLQTTLLIVALTVPSIVLGVPGGTLADVLPRRLSLTGGYLARGLIAVALYVYSDSVTYIYGLILLHSTVGQLFGPAEAATVPSVVRRDQLSAANSLMMLGLGLAQILGMLALAPILIKLVSEDTVFLASAALFFLAALVIGWLAADLTSEEERPPRIPFVEATREGFRILRTSRPAYLAVVYVVTSTALSRVLVILLPHYTREVLQIAAEDTVFVAAPMAIGGALGLVVVPVTAKFAGAWRVMIAGFVIFLVSLLALGFVAFVRDLIVQNFDFGFSFVERHVGVATVITIAMFLAIPLGLGNTMTAIAGRVVMNQEAPAEAQGRVYAVQTAIGDTFSLVPLLMIGAIADFTGARATLLFAAVLGGVVTSYFTFSRRVGPPHRPAQAPSPSAADERKNEP